MEEAYKMGKHRKPENAKASELAQALMLTTGASLCEIALSCGMSDQSHFTRSFRRIVGETPSSWRHTRCGAMEERP